MVVPLDGNPQRVPVLALAQVRERLVAMAQPEDVAANRLGIHPVDDEADVLAAFAPADVQLIASAVVDAAVADTGRVAQILFLGAKFLAAFHARDLAEFEVEFELEVEVLLIGRERAGAPARHLPTADDNAALDAPS